MKHYLESAEAVFQAVESSAEGLTTAQAEERLDLIMNQPAQREGMTEALKAADQMTWVARMSSIRARAEEIVLSELVYG